MLIGTGCGLIDAKWVMPICFEKRRQVSTLGPYSGGLVTENANKMHGVVRGIRKIRGKHRCGLGRVIAMPTTGPLASKMLGRHIVIMEKGGEILEDK